MRLLDKRRQVIVDVADNLVNEALGSGNYEVRPGVRVPVTLFDGTAGDIDSEEIPKALQMGVKYRTAQEDKDQAKAEIAAIKKEQFDRPALAATLGAARGATLGLSDAAIRALGGKEAAESVREIKEASPTASLLGEIGGGVASFVTPAGPVGALTRVLGAPTRAATTLGAKAAEKLVKGSQQLTAVEKMGRALVGGGIEGAAIGLGQTVSEAALADPELTAQKALTNIGMGALFGGSLSAVGRGVLEGGKAAITGTLSQAAKTNLVTQPAKYVAGKLSEMYGSAAGAIKQIDDPAWDKLWDKGSTQFRETVLDAINNPKAIVDDVAKQFDGIKQFGDDLAAVANDGAKIQANILDAQVGRAPRKTLELLDDEDALEFGAEAILKNPVIKGPNLVKAEKEAGLEVFDRIQQAGSNLTGKGDELLAKMRTANETERSFGRAAMYDDATIRDFASRLEDFSTGVAGATKPSEIASAMTSFKNETAQLFKIPKGKTLDIIKVENRPFWETAKELKGYWKGVKDTTVSKEVFGDLGSAMAMRADAISNVLSATDDLMGRFYRIKPGKTMNSREYAPDLAKINSFIVNPDAARNAVRSEAIDSIKTKVREAIDALSPINIKSSQDDLGRLQKMLAKTERLPANAKGAANKAEKVSFLQGKIDELSAQIDDAKRFNSSIEDFRATAAKRVDSFESAFDIAREKRMAALLLNRLESATGRSLMGGFAGAAIPQASGLLGLDLGPVSSGVGFLAGLAVTNPRAMLRYVNAMENAAGGLDKMAQNAVERFARLDKRLLLKEGASGKVIPAVRQSIIREKLRIEPQERPQDDETAFKQHRKKLTELQQDPEALFNRIMESVGEDALQSPRLTIELNAAANRGLAFLESKIPKDPYNPGMYPEDFTPSPVEMSEYSDYVQAVMKPKTLIKQMAAGDINPRTVEAIRAVYPKMYEDLLTQVTGLMMSPKKVPYEQRVQLGILFGVPTVKAMQPDYLARMMALQQNGQQQEPTQQQQQAKPNRSQMVSFRDMKASEREQRSG
jgi:hypothetical protein